MKKEEKKKGADLAIRRERDVDFRKSSLHRVSDEKSDGSVLSSSDDVRIRDGSRLKLRVGRLDRLSFSTICEKERGRGSQFDASFSSLLENESEDSPPSTTLTLAVVT